MVFIEETNQFKGGELISSSASLLVIIDSVVSNIETLQADLLDQFPLIIKASSDS